MTKTWRSTTRGFSTPFAAFSQHYAADSKPLLVNFCLFLQTCVGSEAGHAFQDVFQDELPH